MQYSTILISAASLLVAVEATNNSSNITSTFVGGANSGASSFVGLAAVGAGVAALLI